MNIFNIFARVQNKLFSSTSKEVAKVFGMEEEFRIQQHLNREVNLRSTVPKGKYRANASYEVTTPQEPQLPLGYVPPGNNTNENNQVAVVNLVIQQQEVIIPSSQPSVIQSISEQLLPKVEYQTITLSNENQQVICDPTQCFECYSKQNSNVKAQQVCLTCMTQFCDSDAHMHKLNNPNHVLINKESSLLERWDQLQVAYYRWEEENHLKANELLVIFDRIQTTYKQEDKEINITYAFGCKDTIEKTFGGRIINLYNFKKTQGEYVVELKKKVDDILLLFQDNNPTKIQENCTKFETLLQELEAFLKYRPLLNIMQIKNELPSLTEFKSVTKTLIYDMSVLKL